MIRALAAAGLRVSVDTRHAATMAAALDAGAAIVNDVYALGHDPAAAPLVAARGCPVVLMHMRGTPADMYAQARYDDVAADVTRELGQRIAAAERAGIARGQDRDRSRHRLRQDRRAIRGVAAPAARTWRARLPHPGRRLTKVVPRGGYRASRIRAAACPAPWPPACSLCRGVPPSCGCTTLRKPFRRSGSGGPWHPDECFHCLGSTGYMPHCSRQDGAADDTRETPVRNRRHPRHREHRSDDRRDGAAAGPGGRASCSPAAAIAIAW